MNKISKEFKISQIRNNNNKKDKIYNRLKSIKINKVLKNL